MFCLVLFLNPYLVLEFADILLWVPEEFLAVGPKAPKNCVLIISFHDPR